VRETLQNIHKVARDKTIKEAIVFLLYALMFVGILCVPRCAFSGDGSGVKGAWAVALVYHRSWCGHCSRYEINNIHRTFSQNDALMDLFLDEEFEDATYKKNFYEVMTMGEMWTWLQVRAVQWPCHIMTAELMQWCVLFFSPLTGTVV